MVYQPEQMLFWDFWIAPRRSADEPYHLFHLQAPRSLPDPRQRHSVASVGHAVSRDLIHWEPHPIAFEHGPAGAWDDTAIWTGSIFDHDGSYYFFYTALSSAEQGRQQRIGVATSADLETWERHPANPVLEADPRWYRKRGHAPWEWEACRDPWVVADSEHGGYLMFYTATSNDRPFDSAGVVGAARSTNLVDWEAIPPVTEPAEHRDLEVPQSLRIGDRWYLLYCTQWHSEARLARTGPAGMWHGTHYLVSDSLAGPYRLSRDEALLGDDPGTYYAGRVVDGPDGELVFLAWRQWGTDGTFAGALSNPAKLHVDAAGDLRIERHELWPE